MRLRLLLLTATALLTLVPALAFADEDNGGDTDREPVALTTPVAAAPTTDQVTDRTEHADQVTDRTEHADRVTDRTEHADQVVDRAAWCQTHAEACAAAITAHTDEIIAWCKAHADKCPADELKKVLDRLATTSRVHTTTHRPPPSVEVDKDEKLP
jgi:phage host-nuclease inhibitor protein Gam